MAERVDQLGEVDAGQHADEEVPGGSEEPGSRQRRCRDATQLGQLGVVDVCGSGHGCTEVVEVEVGGVECFAEPVPQRSDLQVGHDRGQALGAESAQGHVHRGLRSRQEGGAHHELGDVDAALILARSHHDAAESVDDHLGRIEPEQLRCQVPVGEPRGGERQDRVPGGIEERLVRGLLVERYASDSQHDHRVAAGGSPGPQHLVNMNTVLSREQCCERLVLRLLQSCQRQRLGVAVPKSTPGLGEQLGVPGVAAVDPHHEGSPGGIGRVEDEDSGPLPSPFRQRCHLYAELLESATDGRDAGPAAGGTEQEMHDGRGQGAAQHAQGGSARRRRFEEDE